MRKDRPSKRRRSCPSSPDRPPKGQRILVAVLPARRDVLDKLARLGTIAVVLRTFGMDAWNMIRPRQRADVRIAVGSRHEVRGGVTLTVERPDDGRVLRV